MDVTLNKYSSETKSTSNTNAPSYTRLQTERRAARYSHNKSRNTLFVIKTRRDFWGYLWAIIAVNRYKTIFFDPSTLTDKDTNLQRKQLVVVKKLNNKKRFYYRTIFITQDSCFEAIHNIFVINH